MNDITQAISKACEGPTRFDVGYEHAKLIKKIMERPAIWPPGSLAQVVASMVARRGE